MTDVLKRFHRTLVEEIRAQRPSYLEGPFTVAEIYQNLVPYGSHRDRIGVEMNGDYEAALLRLLAGEGGYLILDSEHALRELRAELDSPHPNTGLYREFAAVDVRLDPERVPEDEEGAAVTMDELAPESAPAHPDSDAKRAADAARSTGRDSGPASFWSEAGAAKVEEGGDDGPLAAPGGTAARRGGSSSEGQADACRWCRASLPDHANLNFCPFCGTDIRLIPCSECGEEVLPEWRFCVTCGTEVEI